MKVSKKEIAKFQKKEQAQLAGREVNRVQDRKTGEFYNPQERFDALMNKPETLAMLKRLAVR
jgi:predicted nucleotidyltransferase